MTFTKKKISPRVLGVIDIGTYKIRVAICKFHNQEVELLGYGEKRQDTDEISMGNFSNLKSICENISLAIKKAETDAQVSIKDIIINIPFEEIFFHTNKINHVREERDNPIQKKELKSIIKSIESQSLKKHYRHITQTSGYKAKDLRLIIGGISEIKIKKEKISNLLHTNPAEINFSLLNVFIPEHKYEIIQTIGRVLDKKIKKIIPCEFAITKLFKKKQEVVIIDLGSNQTSIIVKKDNKILGVQKHAFGINTLIKTIRQNYNRTKIEIIQTIDQDIYELEKIEFLEIFKDILIISLEEILGEDICPSDFFMIGGGSNTFIRNYFSKANLNKNHLKIVKDISFITPKIEYFQNIDSSKSNLNIYAMMMSTLSFMKHEHDPIEESLREILLEINKD
ncbi:MAG: hypothetical protein GY828_07680 [Candidatus Gracilibacteria bacterium]|nr:hypothetical protein [Candidatus Gracilibacteria bacterium]